MEAEIYEREHPKIKTETDIIAAIVDAKLEARGVRKPNYTITKCWAMIKKHLHGQDEKPTPRVQIRSAPTCEFVGPPGIQQTY